MLGDQGTMEISEVTKYDTWLGIMDGIVVGWNKYIKLGKTDG